MFWGRGRTREFNAKTSTKLNRSKWAKAFKLCVERKHVLGAHENLSLPTRKLPRVGLVCWANTYGRESRSRVHDGTGRKRLLENRPWLCLILMCSSPHSFLSHILGAQLMLVGRRKRTIRICPHAPGEFSGTRVCSDPLSPRVCWGHLVPAATAPAAGE